MRLGLVVRRVSRVIQFDVVQLLVQSNIQAGGRLPFLRVLQRLRLRLPLRVARAEESVQVHRAADELHHVLQVVVWHLLAELKDCEAALVGFRSVLVDRG